MENKNIISNNLNSLNWKPETYLYVGEKRYTDEEFNNAVELLKNQQINDNQQIVLDGLKMIATNYNKEHYFVNGIRYALRDLYWYLDKDYSVLENKKLVNMCESYNLLSANEFAKVLQVFIEWALEQEDENEISR